MLLRLNTLRLSVALPQSDTLLQLVSTFSSLSILCGRKYSSIEFHAFNLADTMRERVLLSIMCLVLHLPSCEEYLRRKNIHLFWSIVLPRPTSSSPLAFTRCAFSSRAKSILRKTSIQTVFIFYTGRFPYLSQLFYLGRSFTSLIRRLQYFIQGYNRILPYTIAFFPNFSYMVLGGLPRLVKGPYAISCGKNINVLLAIYLSRCITVLPLLRSLSSIRGEIIIAWTIYIPI